MADSLMAKSAFIFSGAVKKAVSLFCEVDGTQLQNAYVRALSEKSLSSSITAETCLYLGCSYGSDTSTVCSLHTAVMVRPASYYGKEEWIKTVLAPSYHYH